MSTEVENHTTVTAVPQSPVQQAVPVGPNIKRHITLYRYGVTSTTKIQPLKRFLGKKCWKEVHAIIYDDSTLKVFEDTKYRNAMFEIKLENVALYLAFGKAANKYGPPPITDDERNFVASNNFFAIPETKERDKVHWFAAKDELDLKNLIQAIAETVDGKVNPPQLGKGPKFRYSHDDQESKWKTYWMTCAQQQANAEQDEHVNGGDQPKYVATPLVAIMEEKKAHSTDEKKSNSHDENKVSIKEKKPTSPPVTPSKTSSLKLKPLVFPRSQPARNYYEIQAEMPSEACSLSFTPDTGIVENVDLDEKMTSIRLVNGKRIKEVTVVQKKTTHESSPQPPDYPPPPVPQVIIEEVQQKEVQNPPEIEVQIQQPMEVEPEPQVLTLINDQLIGDQISAESNAESVVQQAPIVSFDEEVKKEENVELMTTQCSTVVNVASVEHTFASSTEYVVNGISSYSTTKETASFQQTTTNGGVVH